MKSGHLSDELGTLKHTQQMNRHTDRQTNGKTNRQTNKWIHRQTDARQTNRHTHIQHTHMVILRKEKNPQLLNMLLPSNSKKLHNCLVH